MNISLQIEQNFTAVFSGRPWYGHNIYSIMEQVTFEAAYEKPSAATHNIAEIVLHMLSWTQEVTARMAGGAAKMPAGGDWPNAGEPDEQKWPQMVSDLKLANVNLQKAIRGFPESKWTKLINDQRDTEPVTTYTGLMEGFLQHQVYHAGQIALLNKQING